MTRRQAHFFAAIAVAVLLAAPAGAAEALFEADMSGGQLVPPVDTPATGFVRAVLDTDTREINWLVTYRGLSGAATGFSFNGPALPGGNAGPLMSPLGSASSPILGGAVVSAARADMLLAGEVYVVVTTAMFPQGELRAQLTLVELEAGGGGED